MLPKLLTTLLESKPPESVAAVSSSHIALPVLLTSIVPAFGLSGAGSGAVALLDSAPINPFFEAQVLTDFSHLSLDLAGFFVPGLIFLRVAAVAGRLCTMAADYIPDHTIFPEEFAFQIGMLTVACLGLAKAALLPVVSASAKRVSVKNGRAYTALFQPAGTTWADFKALSVCALDWITVQAGETVTTDESTTAAEDEYLYWLYSGDVRVESAGELQYTISRLPGKASKQDAGRGLLGERRVLNRLSKIAKKATAATDGIAIPRSTVKATSTATLLRIHTPSVKLLMENDQEFADSIRTLVFQGMEAKLHAQLKETSSLMKSYNLTATAAV